MKPCIGLGSDQNGSPKSVGFKLSQSKKSFDDVGSKQTSPRRPIIINSLFSMRAFDAELDLPIVYCEGYNIHMFGLEFLHKFDTKSYKKLANHLNNKFLDTKYARYDHDNNDKPFIANKECDNQMNGRKLRYLAPNRPINLEELKIHHTNDYVIQIHEDKSLIAKITKFWAINLVPFCLIERRILRPIKLQIAGTIYATHLAMQHGWSINLGGGFHFARSDCGDRFCLFSDIFLAMKYVWRKHPLQKFMIIDLDAHKATGIERDLLELTDKHRQMVFILDVFNNSIQPADKKADKGTNLRVELSKHTDDRIYLRRLDEALKLAFSTFKPTLVFYVAGQDVLKDDQLGLMSLSDDGLEIRDELVFSYVSELNKCPIVMLMGGSYLARATKVQASSMRNLFAKGLIWGGHRSGSRSLTRPRQQAKQAGQTKGQESVSNVNETGQQDEQQASDDTFPVPVNALSESTSTSGGKKRIHIIRIDPKSGSRSKQQAERQQANNSGNNNNNNK